MRLNDVIGKKVAIHCKTQSETERLLKALTKKGIIWGGNSAPAECFDSYCYFGEMTCITIQQNGLWCATLGCMRESGYKIIMCNDLDLEDV